MKQIIFTATAFCFAATGKAQQNTTDTSAVRFTPPVIVKNEEASTKEKPAAGVQFTPPVIVKDKPLKSKKPARNKVRFIPPVIVKDTAEK